MHTNPSWLSACRIGARSLLQWRIAPLMALRLARPVSRPLLLALSMALLASVALLPAVAWAGTIAVNGTTCMLPDAVTAANTDVNVGGCTLLGATSGGADTLPAGFQLTVVISTGATIVKEVNGYRIGQLAGDSTATLYFVGQVDPTLSADQPLNNTATLSSTLTGLLSAQASANVVLPVVDFTDVPTSVTEVSDDFEVTLALNFANPFVEGSVQVVITDTAENGMAENGTGSGVMKGKSVVAVETVIFAPGTTTQQVTVDVPDDGVTVDGITGDRTIQLSLQNPLRLRLGAEMSASVMVSDSTTPGDQPTQIFLPHVEH